jgi:hypothetical protein
LNPVGEEYDETPVAVAAKGASQLLLRLGMSGATGVEGREIFRFMNLGGIGEPLQSLNLSTPSAEDYMMRAISSKGT